MNITLVTCWYKVKSKFNETTYKQWMSNFLNNATNFNLVIYTNKESYSLLACYKDNKNLTIVFKEFEDFLTFKHDWAKNHERNDLLNGKKNHNIDWRLNMLWNEKINFVNDVIKNKIYETEWYGWCDIGYFRSGGFDVSKWPNRKKLEILNKDKIYYARVGNSMSINNLVKLILNKNKYGLPEKEIPADQVSIAGGFFILHKSKIEWWADIYYNTLDLYFKHKYLVKDDQIIIINSIVDNLKNFEIVVERDKGVDPWFVFQRFLL
tara:strand:- start:262 stop:1056 length:795 start_codon:yes stop_codon:yes gene_type:complete